MSENIAVVVSHPEQADHAWRELKENCILFCVSISCYEHSQQKKYRAVWVNDTLLYGKYKSINHWGFTSSFRLFAILKPRGKERIFLESIFTAVKAVFVQIIKSVLAFKLILKEHSVGELVLFEDPKSVFYWICVTYLEQFHPAISIRIWRPFKQKHGSKDPIKKSLLKCLGFFNNLVFRWLCRSCECSEETLGLVSGSLHHLGAVVCNLQGRKSHRLIFCEDTFNFQKFNFCLRNRILFFVLPASKKEFVPDMDARFSFPAGTFAFEQMDVSGLVAEVLKHVFRQNIYHFTYDYEDLIRFFQEHPFRYCLLDEDSVQRRMFAAIAWSSGKKSYVISHGVPAVLMPSHYPEPSLAGRYASSITFVNSEFEKFAYERIYFKSQMLPVTGSPRYDAMFRLWETFLPKDPPEKKKKILYCGALLKEFEFSFPIDVIGSGHASGVYIKRYAKDVFSALSRLQDVELKIKPHYNDEHLWRLHLSSFEKTVPYELLNHTANIFEMLLETDLVITSESTVICEAIMYKKPVIVLNYSPEDLCLPYDDGLILQARNLEDLTRMARQAIEDTFYLQALAQARERLWNCYAGFFDGHNAERVVNHIIKSETCAGSGGSPC